MTKVNCKRTNCKYNNAKSAHQYGVCTASEVYQDVGYVYIEAINKEYELEQCLTYQFADKGKLFREGNQI